MAAQRGSIPPAGPEFLRRFGSLYVINLPARRDRRHDFARQLDRIGLSIADPRVQVFPAIRPAAANGFPGIGAHGCFLSHLGVLRAARDAGLDSLVLCEDDLDFAPDFTARAPAVMAALAATGWDMVYAGHQRLPPADPATAAAGVQAVAPGTEIRCAHFLLLQGRVLAPLIAHLEAMLERPPGDPAGGPMHVDGAYNHFRRSRPGLEVLAVVPALGDQRASRSDISPTRWFDRLPVLREAATLLRQAGLRRRS